MIIKRLYAPLLRSERSGFRGLINHSVFFWCSWSFTIVSQRVLWYLLIVCSNKRWNVYCIEDERYRVFSHIIQKESLIASRYSHASMYRTPMKETWILCRTFWNSFLFIVYRSLICMFVIDMTVVLHIQTGTSFRIIDQSRVRTWSQNGRTRKRIERA